jgi:hypothetical protein
MGKGGPLTCSRGTVPLDAGNKYMIAIEAGNNGVGEPWSTVALDAYIRMLAVLCQAYGFNASRDIFTHHSYCQPSCPGRKVDPAGPTPSKPSLGGTSGNKIWSHDDVRNLVLEQLNQVPPPKPEPEPPPEDEVTQEDIDKIVAAVKAEIPEAVWKYKINDPTGSPQPKMVPAEALFGYTRSAAANADRQTRAGDAKNSVAEEVWGHDKRTLTG